MALQDIIRPFACSCLTKLPNKCLLRVVIPDLFFQRTPEFCDIAVHEGNGSSQREVEEKSLHVLKNNPLLNKVVL